MENESGLKFSEMKINIPGFREPAMSEFEWFMLIKSYSIFLYKRASYP
jgi:hypothetical protein